LTYTAGFPEASRNDPSTAGTDTRYADPVRFWQSEQWQIAVRSGSTSASYVTLPQWQLPW